MSSDIQAAFYEGFYEGLWCGSFGQTAEGAWEDSESKELLELVAKNERLAQRYTRKLIATVEEENGQTRILVRGGSRAGSGRNHT